VQHASKISVVFGRISGHSLLLLYTCTVLEYVPDTEGVAFGYNGASALKFAVAGMLISLVAIWTRMFICFRIESAAAQADQSFVELAGLYAQHRTAIEGIERIQRSGLQIWGP